VARRRWERREAQRRDGGTATSDEKYAYTDAFTADDVQFLRELPYTILLEREAVLVVHAGIVPSVPLHEQRPEHMYTMRNLVRERDGSWQALATTHTGGPWAPEWQPDGTITARHVVFGHDAKRGLQQHAHTTGLDTGACYGGLLTALVLPEWRIVSVPARRMYSEPKEKPPR